MNLEDHLGDIVRKARAMSNVTPATAAKAAGISEAELGAMEDSGQPNPRADLAALAKEIGLTPNKLKSIAEGWLPSEKDLGAWRELRTFTTAGGGITVNAYLVWDEVTREAALFDTGWDPEPAFKVIAENQLQLRHLFITHSHEDHVAGVEAVRRQFPKVRLHSGSKTVPVEQRNRPNDFIHLGSLRITNRDTPGHAEDGVTYIIGTWPDDAPHVAIVGDAIFSASIGRGNISWEVAKQKVRDRIFSLPPQTLICPGHGPLTTVGEEKQNNPFF